MKILKQEQLDRSPYNPSWSEILVKTIIWLVISIFVSFLVFIIYIFSQKLFYNAIVNLQNNTGLQTTNPMISLIMAIIWFIWSFIWTLIIWWAYNIIYQDKYYDIWKMLSVNLIMNSFLFVIALMLYLIFNSNMEILFWILVFHILFSTFSVLVSYDIITNPNYSVAYLIWNSIGFFISLFLIALFFKLVNLTENPNRTGYFLIFPILITYTLIPLFSSIREKIYYKFYENWNNFLYIPSLDEILVDEEEVEDINVDTE